MAIQHLLTTPYGDKKTSAYTRLEVSKKKVKVLDKPETDKSSATYKLAWRLFVEPKTYISEAKSNEVGILSVAYAQTFWSDIVAGEDIQDTAYKAAMKRAEFINGIQV